MRVFPSEIQTFVDKKANTIVRQLTSQQCINHHPFFLIPAYDRKMQWIFFVSHRTGSPQIFGIELDSYKLIQFTDVPDLTEWSVHPDLSGEFVYFTTNTGGWQLEISSGRIRNLFNYQNATAKASGMVAGGMGTTALSPNGIYWAFPYNTSDGVTIMKVDTRNGIVSEITTHDAVAHMQFCPEDDELLYFAGNFKERLWTINVDGTGKTKHGHRKKGQWITHESWIPGKRELMFVDWPYAVRSVAIDTEIERTIAHINAWHAICDMNGEMVIADTNCPDIGIKVFSTNGTGKSQTLCYPQSSNAGDHWNGPFPYENGPIRVNAPQHTHPHPRFSPDRKRIIYTSDSSGFAQVYEIDYPG